MRYCVLDNEYEELNQIKKIFNSLQDELKFIEVDYFDNYGDIDIINSNYDALFFDINLNDDINGIIIAKKYKQYHNDVKIVFISNHSDYALDTHQVGLHNFIQKANINIDLPLAIRDIYSYQKKNSILTKSKKRNIEVLFDNIIFIESYYRTTQFVLVDNNTIYDNRHINELIQLLPNNFFKLKINCIINLDKLIKIEGNIMYMKGDHELELPRGKKKEILYKISNYFDGNKK
ncbi:LytR/AlgR family response regulator transcription factor [Tannockella kyphosi]|uniref:LytR/AlgR family response regulator transcription factor n=1 Tax=Tannockella kyphosi TaxID=2899121 RepID=UPI002012EABB|nr:response regulator [Tannockella kyphosi]